jgi:SAM-dependent methyltransferase
MTRASTESQSQETVVEVYNQQALRREAVRDNWAYMTSKQLTDFALIDEAGIDGATVLNIGCFYPIDEILFAHRVKRWIAADLGEETVRVAEAAARGALSPDLFCRLEFVVADGTALPFKDGEFDVTVSMSTVDHVPNGDGRQRFIAEMARVTRSGGHVVLTVPNRWSRGYAKRKNLVPANEAPEFFEYCFSPRELRRLVQDAGLEIIRFTSTSEIPALAPRPVLSSIARRPALGAWNAIARYFGARMGVLAVKPHT